MLCSSNTFKYSTGLKHSRYNLTKSLLTTLTIYLCPHPVLYNKTEKNKKQYLSFQWKIIINVTTDKTNKTVIWKIHCLYIWWDVYIVNAKPLGITTDMMFPTSLNNLNWLSNHITNSFSHFRDPSDHQSLTGKRKGVGGVLSLCDGSSYKNKPYFWSSLGQRDGVPQAWCRRFQFSSSTQK